MVAQISSVSVFAFIDKQGVVTENQKYVDEIAIIDQNEEKVILDLEHDQSASSEYRVYKFEGSEEQRVINQSQLNALGLAMMLI